MNNFTLIDDDLNESIISFMPTKRDLIQLEVDEECVDNQFGEISDAAASMWKITDKSKHPRQSTVKVEDNEKSKE